MLIIVLRQMYDVKGSLNDLCLTKLVMFKLNKDVP